jgi:rubrerythrin
MTKKPDYYVARDRKTGEIIAILDAEEGKRLNWECTWCGYQLTHEQYTMAIFDRCPRCTRHLSLWGQL